MGIEVPVALSIAGSDSGGGAGIQADLKTFTALRVFGASVITSVTAQNTKSVLGISDLEPEFVKLQLDAVLGDIGADAAKLGMLSNEGIIKAVSDKIRQYNIKKLVLDPVMRSKAGEVLLQKEAEQALIDEILPISYIVTPNVPEAEILAAQKITTLEDMRESAVVIKALGPDYVLVKGGHLSPSAEATDILYDGENFLTISSPRIDTKNTHGTGCTYSASICALLARGYSVIDAVKASKRYVYGAIKGSFSIGGGHGPLNHFWEYEIHKEGTANG